MLHHLSISLTVFSLICLCVSVGARKHLQRNTKQRCQKLTEQCVNLTKEERPQLAYQVQFLRNKISHYPAALTGLFPVLNRRNIFQDLVHA